MHRLRPRHLLASLSIAMSSIVFTAGAAQAAITAVPNTGAGAATLADAMLVDPSILTSASFDAVPPSGTPNGTSDGLNSFPTHGPTFAILTTGNVNFADDPNSGGSTGANLGGGSVRGNTDRDVTVLKLGLNVPAGANCMRFDFKFFSEEFPEYVGSSFNDAFIAELDSSTWTTSGSTITAPNNFAFDPNGNVISINTTGSATMTAAEAAGTTYDGATPLLSAVTPITPGAHSLYLSIFDQGDHIYDSAVFLDNLRVGFVADPANDCRPGAQLAQPTQPCDALPNPLPAGTIFAVPGQVTFGTPGDDVIVGTEGDDRIAGLGGNDRIYGLGGNDQLSGGDGDDLLCGGDGNDELSGGDGNDELYGGDGDDSLSGGPGDDYLNGGPGADRLSGGLGTDECVGGGQVGDQAASCEAVTP